MEFAQINVDQKEVKRYINEKLDEIIHETFFMWDLDQMEKRTCMSKSFLEAAGKRRCF